MYTKIACGFLDITYVALDIIWLYQIFKETKYSAFIHSASVFQYTYYVPVTG